MKSRSLNRKNSSELAPGLQPEEEFEKPLVSQVQDSSKIPRSSAARSFIRIFFHTLGKYKEKFHFSLLHWLSLNQIMETSTALVFPDSD